MRREDRLHAGQRRRLALRRGQVVACTIDLQHALDGEKTQQGGGVAFGQGVAHFHFAAQFDGGRQAGGGNRIAAAEVRVEIPPQAAAGFVERLFAGRQFQQHGARAQERG
ncbi:hypothetical protein D3C72_1257080 [compost metagenome]